MPELPEVETTLRGILPHTQQHIINDVVVRDARLRWPIPPQLATTLRGRRVDTVQRRGKYLVFSFGHGHMLLHLGMSGSLRLVTADEAPRPHDHVDWLLDNGRILRLHDPRRFGAVLWTAEPWPQHELLSALGPEPFDAVFDANYLFAKSRKRALAIKNFIMDSHIVVGVGNIYASESLFLAGIHPQREAGTITRARYQRLVEAIRQVLDAAIRQGGTTLRDFVNGHGQPGYFRQMLNVYEKEGMPCPRCARRLRRLTVGQRSSYFCAHCQR